MKKSQLYSGIIGLFFQLLYIIYTLNGVIYSNGLVTNLLIITSILLSSYYCVLIVGKTKNKFTIYLSLFILLSIFQFTRNPEMYLSFGGTLITRTYSLKIILFALMTYFPFYYIGYKYGYDSRKVIPLFIAMFFISILKFITKREELEYEGVESGMNVAYTFVACLPIAALYMRKILSSYIVIGILMVLIIISMKRGAIITGGIAIVYYLYSILRKKGINKNKRIINIISLFVFGGILIIIAYNSIVSNAALINRFSTISEGSGRDMIYETLIDKWIHPDSPINFIIGYGMNSSVRFSGFFAHSDWLEIMITSGLLGIIIYGLLIYSLYKNYKILSDDTEKNMLGMILIIWCVSSVFSMFYFHSLTFTYMMFIGIILGNNDRKIRQNINS